MENKNKQSIEYVNNLPNTIPAPAYFSQAVWAGNTAYISGQVGLDPISKKVVSGGLAAETEQIFDNTEAILKGLGLSLNDVAKVSVYLTDIADFAAMNEIYVRRFGAARPARETVAVKDLAVGAKIEITMTAYKVA